MVIYCLLSPDVNTPCKPNTYLTLLMRPILTMKKHIYFRVNIDVVIICKSRAHRTFGLLFKPALGFSLSCPLIAHLSSLPFFPPSYLSRLALHITMAVWVAFQAGFGVCQIWLIRLHAHASLWCACVWLSLLQTKCFNGNYKISMSKC